MGRVCGLTIYDSYHMYFTNGHYATELCIFCQGDYLEIMMDDDDLFHSINHR